MTAMWRRVTLRAWRSRTVCAIGALVVLTAAAVAAQQGATYSHTYYGNLPDEGKPGWHHEMQGLDHDESHWYMSQNPNAVVSLPAGTPLPGKCSALSTVPLSYSCPNPRLWRTPATTSLGTGVSCGNPRTSGSGTPVCTSLLTSAYAVWALGYDHFGDITFYAPDAAHRYVVVPIEGRLKGGPGLAGAFAFFNADDLSFVAWAEAPGMGITSAWSAIDASGHLYSSPKNTAGLTDTVLKFRVDWAALAADPPEARLEILGSVELRDSDDAALTLGEYLQGGTFASPGLMYLLNGQGDRDCPGCGIRLFEITDSTTGAPCGLSDGACVARQVAQSTNGGGAFNFEFHPGWSRYEEPEGLTWWDLTAPGAPAVPGVTSSGLRVADTQLHAILLDNDFPDSDDVYVKHYRVEVPPTTGVAVTPTALAFDRIDVGASRTLSVQIANAGTTDLSVNALDITGGGGLFALASPIVPPVVLTPGTTTDVPVRFTPTASGLATATLAIASTDPVRPLVSVPLSGLGVSLIDQVRDLLDTFDDGLAQGVLVPIGSGASAANRAAAFRQMLALALAAIEQGDVATACEQLRSAYLLVDGADRPADFIGGTEASAFAAELAETLANLGCPVR